MCSENNACLSQRSDYLNIVVVAKVSYVDIVLGTPTKETSCTGTLCES